MIVGLTGGIGSGKSTVAEIFKHLGVPIISADEIARHIVETDKAVLPAIVKKFGQEYLTAEYKLDRQKLARRIFQNPAEKLWLEQLLHPLIRAELASQAKQVTYPYCIMEIPLLLESKLQDFVDRILTVDCPEDMQIQRAIQRGHYTQEEVSAIMAQQVSRAKRLHASNEVLENIGNLTTLTKHVHKLHERYLSLATFKN
jgi:dephospho-CoA kinase